MPNEVRLTIFVLLIILLVVAFFFLFFFNPIRRLYYKKNKLRYFYNAVMRVARNGDYYLVNNLTLKVGSKDSVRINHIIGGDKYIYVITDRYFEGAVNVKPNDQKWVNYVKGNKKRDVVNPLYENRFAVDRLSLESGINSSFLIGIVLINSDCFLSQYQNSKGNSLLVPANKLEKVVTSFEKKEDVTPFVKKQLWQTIHDLAELRSKNDGK